MRISDWSSDVCSSDLVRFVQPVHALFLAGYVGALNCLQQVVESFLQDVLQLLDGVLGMHWHGAPPLRRMESDAVSLRWCRSRAWALGDGLCHARRDRSAARTRGGTALQSRARWLFPRRGCSLGSCRDTKTSRDAVRETVCQ